MLVFNRLISWVLAILTVGSFVLVMKFPTAAIGIIGVFLLLTAFFYTQLIELNKKTYDFWNFLLTPFLLMVSGSAFYLFLENTMDKYVLIGGLAFLSFIYAEHLFYFFHLPSRYRVYTLERLSIVFYVVTTFLLSSVLFGLLLLVNIPLWVVAPIFFLLSVFLTYSTLWVSKIDRERAFPYAIAGALLLTELFVAISFLPTGHMTSSALITVFLYVFLGFTRAHLLGRLTRTVLLRYLVFTAVVLLVILATA
ncbi:MAG: hypothetical protein O2877_01120, partial [bacterium]|nr:hypothetical protein [bacterium]